jgi:putative ATP-binding cassette transporter
MRRSLVTLAEAWRLAAPFWRSEERGRALLQLGLLVALNLTLVGITVVYSFWSREFFNAMQNKDQKAFLELLLWWHKGETGWLPGFVVFAGVFILVAVYQTYLRQALQIRWRRWMTRQYLDHWLGARAYYRVALTDPGTDNPDQRIAEDIRDFIEHSLVLGFGILRNLVTLVSFVAVLWSLSGAMTVFGVQIPGYLVWIALVYSVLGTWLANLIGRRLIPLNFNQQKTEADFRYALVRLRENAEGIALYGGEAEEKRGLLRRFTALVENWWAIMVTTKQLTFFTAGFNQTANVFPYVVVSPAYFSGAVTLGVMTQTAQSFGEVQGALSWFVDNYRAVAEWRAIVARLTGFDQAMQQAQREAAAGSGVHAVPGQGAALTLDGVTLRLPDGRVLLRDIGAEIAPGETVLIGGASGSGKSTLFRAIAGIWPYGEGTVRVPQDAVALFLPQRPYLPLGTLRHALCYPRGEDRFTEAEIRAALADAGLGHLAPRLDEEDAWDRRLSGGEQQRVALARALLLKPAWLFLDEATASLDSGSEAHFYRLLRERLPGTALVSIAHRPSVAQYHARLLRVQEGRLVEASG